MKNTLLLIQFIILWFTCNSLYGNTFSYNNYVAYDEHFYCLAPAYHFPDFGYRNNQADYVNGMVKADVFVYYANRTTKRMQKPFVFVEGISFDRDRPSLNQYFYTDYFLQGGAGFNHSNPDIRNIFEEALLVNNPGNNPFIGNSTFNWATLVTGVDAEGMIQEEPLRVEKLPELLNKLLCLGYDIVLVDFYSGQQYLENNGNVLQVALDSIYQRTQQTGSQEKMVVCGASMGGVLARYAIRKMELMGHPDRVSHFISFDAPQQGANIPLGLQYALKNLSQWPLVGGAALEAYKKLTCPSASQLVRFSCLSINPDPSVLYTNPNESLERLQISMNPNMVDWPTSCRKISITNGSRLGLEQNNGVVISGGALLDGTGMIDLDIHSLPGIGNGFSILMELDAGPFCLGLGWAGGLSQRVFINQSLPLDQLAGSYRRDISRLRTKLPEWLFANPVISGSTCGITPAGLFSSSVPDYNHCFIPLLSSAGIKAFDQSTVFGTLAVQNLFQGRDRFMDPQHLQSHFDIVYAPLDNQEHVQITDENIEWLISELAGSQEVYYQNEVVQAGLTKARELITAGFDVSKYGQGCMQSYTPEMYPQYNYTSALINTCGQVSVSAGAQVVWHSGERIILEPGFSTAQAAYFEASIVDSDSCGGSRKPFFPSTSLKNRGIQSILSYSEATPLQTFEIYPNPADDKIWVDGAEVGDLLRVYNSEGRCMAEQNCMQSGLTGLAIEDYPDGIYLIELKKRETISRRKLIKRSY